MYAKVDIKHETHDLLPALLPDTHSGYSLRHGQLRTSSELSYPLSSKDMLKGASRYLVYCPGESDNYPINPICSYFLSQGLLC